MTPCAVEVCGLCKSYRLGARIVQALRGVDLSVQVGEVFGLLGPNGAGKTTLVKIISRLITPDRGTVALFGTRDYATGDLGVVLEGNRNLQWRMTPLENLVYYAVLRGLPISESRQRAKALLSRFGLQDWMGVPVQKLSRGMQQKVAIAASVIHNPKLLILDEPTLGLDVGAVEETKELIREIGGEGTTILLCSHDLEVVSSLCSRVVVINEGAVIAQGSPSELARAWSQSRDTVVVEFDGLSSEDVSALTAAGVTASDNAAGLTLSAPIGDRAAVKRLLEFAAAMSERIRTIRQVEASLRDAVLELMARPARFGNGGRER